MILYLGGKLEQDLKYIIRLRAPHEAVGMINGECIIELPNRHEDPTHNFLIHREDIKSALERSGQINYDELVLWHSHPHGGVGPSRIDMQQKTQFPYHLVLTLSADTLIPSWY